MTEVGKRLTLSQERARFLETLSEISKGREPTVKVREEQVIYPDGREGGSVIITNPDGTTRVG